jgi:hypothetical protein
MKKEDLWMIGLVVFSILWTASFGWGARPLLAIAL